MIFFKPESRLKSSNIITQSIPQNFLEISDIAWGGGKGPPLYHGSFPLFEEGRNNYTKQQKPDLVGEIEAKVI